MMSAELRDLYRRIDRLSKHGDPSEQELAVHLIHEIDDYLGKGERVRVVSTKGLQDTPSATST